MWDLPGPGMEPVSPKLAGGFFTLSHQGSLGVSLLISKPQKETTGLKDDNGHLAFISLTIIAGNY